MKTKLLSLALFVMAVSTLIALPSCKSENEENFLGTWYTDLTKTQNGDGYQTVVSVSYTETNTADGQQIASSKMTCKVNIDNEEISNALGENLEISFTMETKENYTWEIKKDQLTEKCTNYNVECTSISTNINDKEVEKQVLSLINADKIIQELINDLKKDAYDDGGGTIVNLTNSKMVIKDTEGNVDEWHR